MKSGKRNTLQAQAKPHYHSFAGDWTSKFQPNVRPPKKKTGIKAKSKIEQMKSIRSAK